MVADRVTIDTLSCQDGATPVHWESDGGTEYEISNSDKTERGTEITLYLNEESYEFSNEYRVKEVLQKYCSFMPVDIYFVNANAPVEEDVQETEADHEDVIDASVDQEGVVSEEDETKSEEKEDKTPKPINNTTPLWTKHPNDCTDEEYKEFYRDVFHDYKEPLFWIHLNMDYPFNLKGILYFPQINTEYDSIEGLIKLYNNQVFIADNIKEVIPEFLMLLKGVIDCPDLPLNVSRSALQNDGFVKKISDYITKKVADKLSGMYKVDRENYEKYWSDINPFIKFGCLKDEKFKEKMKDFIIFKNLEDKYITIAEYVEKNKPADTDETVPADEKKECDCKEGEPCDCGEEHHHEDEVEKTTIYYITDAKQQSQYINMFKEAGLDAFFLTHNIDQPFITQLEYMDQTIKFQRIDADLTDSFKEETKEKDQEVLKNNTDAMTKLFREVLGNEKLEVKVEKLKNENVSSMITLSEESRRMQEMMRMYSMQGMDPGMFGGNETLVLNANNKLVQYIITHEKSEQVSMICEQLYDLAMLSHKPLEAEAMTKFIQRSNEINAVYGKIICRYVYQ